MVSRGSGTEEKTSNRKELGMSDTVVIFECDIRVKGHMEKVYLCWDCVIKWGKGCQIDIEDKKKKDVGEKVVCYLCDKKNK